MPIDFSLIRSGKIVVQNDRPENFHWLVYFLQNSGVSYPDRVLPDFEFYWVYGSDCRFSNYVADLPNDDNVYPLSELLDDYSKRTDKIF